MKQIIQKLDTGDTLLLEVPVPTAKSKHVISQFQTTLLSAGTERMLVDFGKSGLIQKAASQPEKVRQVVEKVKTDGIAATYEAISSKLDQRLPLGYSNVGNIIE